MKPILVTGWSGSGKSTLCRELKKRGYDAIDTDIVDGLCGWVDIATGINYGRVCPDFRSLKYYWNWDENTLRNVLAQHPAAFFCGNANNAFDFYSLFEKVFVMDLPEAEQRRRMMARTEHNFGQDLKTQDIVITRQKTLLPEAKRLGGIVIDASPAVNKVADNIVRLSGVDTKLA